MSGDAKGTTKKVILPGYALTATVDVNAAKKPIKVVFVSQTGIIADVALIMLKVGSIYDVEISLPKASIHARMRVFKTYDRAVDIKEHKVERMAEFQFLSLTEDQKANIVAFTRSASQKVPGSGPD